MFERFADEEYLQTLSENELCRHFSMLKSAKPMKIQKEDLQRLCNITVARIKDHLEELNSKSIYDFVEICARNRLEPMDDILYLMEPYFLKFMKTYSQD